MVLHKSITERRIVSAVKRDDGTGFCAKCGRSQKYVEPDASFYPCNKCGMNAVFGAEQLLLETVS